ncbi:hypothetical protein ACFVAV_06130 [Nocardia sp. NPDC057663]|uniref:hypothetical protein n=1 Tax=Nocardia sp. NPDC057663 TaxID=3346201 RepID=UPI00366F65B9
MRQVLHQWLDGEIAWAYRDFEKAGWATVQDWAQHTKQQAEEIQRLGGELGKATDTIERLNTKVRKPSARIDAVESDLKGAKADLSLEQGKVEECKRQKARDAETFEKARSLIEKAIGQRDQHAGAASALEAQLEAEREAHNRTEAALVWRARLVKVLLAVCLMLAVLVLLSSY